MSASARVHVSVQLRQLRHSVGLFDRVHGGTGCGSLGSRLVHLLVKLIECCPGVQAVFVVPCNGLSSELFTQVR